MKFCLAHSAFELGDQIYNNALPADLPSAIFDQFFHYAHVLCTYYEEHILVGK